MLDTNTTYNQHIPPVSRCWHPVRSKPGPGCLHSHSAVKLLNLMVLFGGEKEGQTVNEIWHFHFGECILQLDGDTWWCNL